MHAAATIITPGAKIMKTTCALATEWEVAYTPALKELAAL
jgi:hypothetical protein